MKLKFTKEEMALLNSICDIEEKGDGIKVYSMKPTMITDEGYTDIETVSAFKLKNEGFITTDIVDRRGASSLPDIVRRLSEMRCTSPDFHPLREEEMTKSYAEKSEPKNLHPIIEDKYQHLSFKTLTDASEVSFGMMIQYVDSQKIPLSWNWAEVDKKIMRMVQNMPKEKYQWVRIPCYN